MAWLDFERGVEARSGHGPSTNFLRKISAGERRSRPERSFATPGQNKRPREKQDKTGPANYWQDPEQQGQDSARVI